MGCEARGLTGGAPAFEQQSPEQLLSVLRPNLVLVDEAV